MNLELADTREFFDAHGFCVFRNAFSSEEISKLRGQCVELFSRPSAYEGDLNNDSSSWISSYRLDLFNRYADFRWAFFKPEIQTALRKILGEISFVPETVAHQNGFGDWHKDTTCQEIAGHKFHYDPESLMVECGIYLQDNHPAYGGGLDVVPGTHHLDHDEFIGKPSNGVVQKVINRVKRHSVKRRNQAGRFSIPSKAGDFVFFNKRLNHRGTPRKDKNVPPEFQKFAIFFICGRRNVFLEKYTDFIATRYSYLNDYRLDPDFVSQSREHGIDLLDWRTSLFAANSL